MKSSLKKFTCFEDLKADYLKVADDKLRLKKHEDFEKVVKSLVVKFNNKSSDFKVK